MKEARLMSDTDKWKKEKDFVAYLEKMVDNENLGALAALRRGLAGPPGMAFEMYKYIVPWVGDSPRWEAKVYYLVSALLAWHQIPWHSTDDLKFSNLGTSLHELKDASNAESLEKRFIALLNCHRDDLHVQLKQLFGLLVAKKIVVNYVQLIKDLKNWDNESHYVQQNWANEFWKE